MYDAINNYLSALTPDDSLRIFTIGFVINLVCMILCPVIAGYKRRSVTRWFLGGLFLSLLGFIIIVCLPSRRKKSRHRRRYDDYDDYDDEDDED